MPRKKQIVNSDKVRPSAKYFRLHPHHEQAVKHWVELHGADETIVYKVGAFLFMTLPLEQRVRVTRQYLEWVREDYPTETLNWPDESRLDQEVHTTGRLEMGFSDRIGEIGTPASSK